ncbi:MAG: hypothetical protein LBK58_08740 [Prevotellaceae bacterium]|jgi:hypothetical protein|nr:hypothetical protein [Prevotellaceae bacterium]
MRKYFNFKRAINGFVIEETALGVSDSEKEWMAVHVMADKSNTLSEYIGSVCYRLMPEQVRQASFSFEFKDIGENGETLKKSFDFERALNGFTAKEYDRHYNRVSLRVFEGGRERISGFICGTLKELEPEDKNWDGELWLEIPETRPDGETSETQPGEDFGLPF